MAPPVASAQIAIVYLWWFTVIRCCKLFWKKKIIIHEISFSSLCTQWPHNDKLLWCGLGCLNPKCFKSSPGFITFSARLKAELSLQILVGDKEWACNAMLLLQMEYRTVPMQIRSGWCAITNGTWSSLTNTVCAVGLRKPIWPEEMMGWILSVVLFSAVCLWLSNEALLIQISVNDYLIIPVLQRAPSPVCAVHSECTAWYEPLICCVWIWC